MALLQNKHKKHTHSHQEVILPWSNCLTFAPSWYCRFPNKGLGMFTFKSYWTFPCQWFEWNSSVSSGCYNTPDMMWIRTDFVGNVGHKIKSHLKNLRCSWSVFVGIDSKKLISIFNFLFLYNMCVIPTRISLLRTHCWLNNLSPLQLYPVHRLVLSP